MTDKIVADEPSARPESTKNDSSVSLSNHAMDLLGGGRYYKDTPLGLTEGGAINNSLAANKSLNLSLDWSAYNAELVKSPAQQVNGTKDSEPKPFLQLPEPKDPVKASAEQFNKVMHPTWGGVTWGIASFADMGKIPNPSAIPDKDLYPGVSMLHPHKGLGVTAKISF